MALAVLMAIGASGNNGSIANRQMRTPSWPDVLSYNLYRDAARTSVWGQTAGVDTMSSTLSVPNNASRGGHEEPLELTVITLAGEAGAIEVPVGRGGEFYVENVPAGRYAARVIAGGQPCTFTITIPDTDEPFIRLAPIVACPVR